MWMYYVVLGIILFNVIVALVEIFDIGGGGASSGPWSGHASHYKPPWG
jgi:hypothetical protein